MFKALRFMVSMMVLISIPMFPNEQEITTRLGAAILLSLYVIEDAAKTIKDIIKEIKGKKEGEAE